MFLCHMEDDGGGLSAGAFSAIFVQLVIYEYEPLLEITQKKWLLTFVVRLLYEFVNEPENYELESIYQLLNNIIIDINFAIDEINFFCFLKKKYFYPFNAVKSFKRFKNVIYLYLRLLNHFSFLGYQQSTMIKEEKRSVKKVVKKCVIKLNYYQLKKTKDNLSSGELYEINNYIFNNVNINNGETESQNLQNNKISSNIFTSEPCSIQSSVDSTINFKGLNNVELQNMSKIFEVEEDANGNENEEIPESLRIPLYNIEHVTEAIIQSLERCNIYKPIS